MYNAGKSPFLYKPKRIEDLNNMFFKTRSSMLLSAGTHIFHHRSVYPDFFALNIIDMSANEKFLTNYVKRIENFEIDCNVKLSTLLEDDSLPKLIQIAISQSIPFSVARSASIGGTIYPDNIIYDLNASLVALSASVLLHKIEKGKIIKKQVSLENLCSKISKIQEYDSDEVVNWQKMSGDKIFIEKLYIPRNDNEEKKYFYKKESNSFFSPSLSVVIAGDYSIYEQNDHVSKVNLAVCYADKGCYLFHDTMQAMNTTGSQYISSGGIKKIRDIFAKELDKFFIDEPRNKKAMLIFDDIMEEIQYKIY